MPKKLKSALFSKDLLYFAKQDRYTLLEQSVGLSNWLFYKSVSIYVIQTSLFVPHAAIHACISIPRITLTAEDMNWGTKNDSEGMQAIKHNYRSLALSNRSL